MLEVKAGKLTASEASHKYGIPRKTINNHVQGKIVDFNRTGRERALTDVEEAAIIGHLKYMSRSNFPLRRCEVKGLIVVMKYEVIKHCAVFSMKEKCINVCSLNYVVATAHRNITIN